MEQPPVFLSELSWKKFLSLPAYVINLDRRPERLWSTFRELENAGFSAVKRWPAVNGLSRNMEAIYQRLGVDRLADVDNFVEHQGIQGCTLSHIQLWQHLHSKNIDIAHIFEDDVCFGSQWQKHAPEFLSAVPSGCELLYMGAQLMGNHLSFLPRNFQRALRQSSLLRQITRLIWPKPSRWIGDLLQSPVFCTHAYTVTRSGYDKLLRFSLSQQIGLYGIDFMIYDGMSKACRVSPLPLDWWVWNGTRFVDNMNERGFNRPWIIRNSGLAYQRERFSSDIMLR